MGIRHRWVRAAVVAAAATSVLPGAACSSTPTGAPERASSTPPPPGSPPSAASPTKPARPSLAGYTPVFEPGPCPVTPSSGFAVDCGTVSVPEDRAKPQGSKVRLAVARIHATGPNPAPDPVVRLEGGPGFGSLDRLANLTGSVLTERRDVIWFDQRGTGTTTPSLNCPEREEAVWKVLGQHGPYDAELAIVDEAMRRCHDRLRTEGIQIAHYNTAASAADVADIRRALGVDQWNLQGTSYGTALAQEVMRSYPEGVRSVLLDSVYPVDERAVDSIGSAAANSIDVLVAGCNASAACRAAHPDLATEIRTIVADYDRQPLELDLADPAGVSRHLVIDGADIQAGLFNAMYDTELLPAIPLGIGLIGQRDKTLITTLATAGFGQLLDVSEGVFYAVECQDRYADVTTQQVADVVAADPRMAFLYLVSPPPACNSFLRPPTPTATRSAEPVPGFTEPMTWDGPVLVLAGTYDPVTPVAWSRRVAGWLPKSTFVVFDGTGHGVFRANDCANRLVIAFYESPTAPVDTSCVATVGPPNWATAPS